jgi:hypothetical protein
MWKDYPNDTTPVMASTLQGYDNVISDIEDELVKLKDVATTGNYNDLANRLIPDGTTITKDADGKIHASGGSGGTSNYPDLTNKPSVNGHILIGNQTTADLGINIPTKVSQLQNDAGYLTQHQSLDGYATETWVNNKKYATQGYVSSALSNYAEAKGISDGSNLNECWYVGLYWGIAGNTITNKPSEVDEFALVVENVGANILQTLHTTTQTFKRSGSKDSSASSWTSWVEDNFATMPYVNDTFVSKSYADYTYANTDGTYDDMTVGYAKQINIADQSDTMYLLGVTGTGSGNKEAKRNVDLRTALTKGTASTEGSLELRIGNSTAKGTEGNLTGKIRFYGNGTNYATLYPASNYTTNVTFRLPTTGGTLAIEGTSSRYAKENIHLVSDKEVRKLLDLEIVSFDYKEKFGGQKDQVGVIAEDAVKILPNPIVIPEGYDENTYDIDTEDTTEVPYVQYQKYVPYLIRMIQLQEQRIAELERKVLE